MIFCEHALFFSKEPTTVIREFERILKKKGWLIVSAHNRYVQSLCFLHKIGPEELGRAHRLLLRKEHGSMTKNGRVNIYTLTPNELQTMLEENGFQVEKIIGKGVTMPIRISRELFVKKEYSIELFEKLLQLELATCERQNALALAGHLQAVACKR